MHKLSTCTILALTTGALSLIGCLSESSFGGAGLQRLTGQQPQEDPSQSTSSQDSNPGPKGLASDQLFQDADYKSISTMDTADFLEKIVDDAPGGGTMIEGRMFESVYDKVLECESFIDDLSTNYSTLGELFESAEIYSNADLNNDDFESMLDSMETIHNEGPNFFKTGDLSELEDSTGDSGGGDTSISLRGPLRLTLDEYSCNGAARNAACCVAVAVAVCAQ